MNIFSVDKLVFNAVSAYKLTEYQKANEFLDKALSIDNKDFTANLWKIRTMAMLGKYTEAIDAISAYTNKKLNAKLSEMLLEWNEFCIAQIQPTTCEYKDIISMNQETDKLLEQYQHQRDFKFLDVIGVFGLLIIVTLLVILFRVSADIRIDVTSVIYLFIVIFYYYCKAILPANIYDVYQYMISKVRQMYKSKLFIYQAIFIFLMTFSHACKIRVDLVDYKMLITFISTVVVFPIFEEVITRGFLYGYLKKYNKLISWTIVSLVFYGLHLQDATFWHIIISIIFLRAYDNEKTILAPIILHMLNNVMNIGMYI